MMEFSVYKKQANKKSPKTNQPNNNKLTSVHPYPQASGKQKHLVGINILYTIAACFLERRALFGCFCGVSALVPCHRLILTGHRLVQNGCSWAMSVSLLSSA